MKRDQNPLRFAAKASRAAAGGAALTLMMAGCGSGEDTGAALDDVAQDVEYSLDGVSIRLGAAQEQALGVGTSYMIEILENWGAEVEFIELTNLTGLEAMVADEIDMAARSSDEFLRAVDQDVEVTAVGEPNSAMHYALVSEPGIDEVTDLEGQEIAISGSGGFDTFLLGHLLPEAGLEPDEDVEYIPIGGSGERTSALLAGQASAAIVFLDDWISMQNQGADLQLTGYIEDLVPGLSARVYYALDTLLDDNPELTEAIACANLMANRMIVEDPEGFVDYTTSNVQGTDGDDVADFHETAIELDMYPTEPDQLLAPDNYTELSEILFGNEEISEVVPPEELFDTEPIHAAADQGCGS